MGISSRISHFSSVTSLVLAGLSCAALVAACSSDDGTTSGTNTGTSTSTTDAGTSADAGESSSASDSGTDAGITIVSGDSGPNVPPVTKYTVSATVTGVSGTGLVLLDSGGDPLTVAANGTFPFATALADTTGYEVTVGTQPSNPTQTCVVTDGKDNLAGANATVTVACTTNTYKVGGTVTGLLAKGLVVTSNAKEDLSVGAPAILPGTFTFTTAIESNGTYDVELTSQPTNQFCSVTGNKGPIVASDITSVAVACTGFCVTPQENNTQTLSCPPGQTIATIDFASYGTPKGACGSFVADPNCDANKDNASVVTVQGLCLGKASCDVTASNAKPLYDPCSGIGKRLFVQASCK